MNPVIAAKFQAVRYRQIERTVRAAGGCIAKRIYPPPFTVPMESAKRYANTDAVCRQNWVKWERRKRAKKSAYEKEEREAQKAERDALRAESEALRSKRRKVLGALIAESEAHKRQENLRLSAINTYGQDSSGRTWSAAPLWLGRAPSARKLLTGDD